MKVKLIQNSKLLHFIAIKFVSLNYTRSLKLTDYDLLKSMKIATFWTKTEINRWKEATCPTQGEENLQKWWKQLFAQQLQNLFEWQSKEKNEQNEVKL